MIRGITPCFLHDSYQHHCGDCRDMNDADASMTARETGAVEILKRELERQKVPFARCASENVVFIYNSPALDLAAMAAALSRPQPTPSATGEIAERATELLAQLEEIDGNKAGAFALRSGGIVETHFHKKLEAVTAFSEQQAATIAERDERIAVLREAIDEALRCLNKGCDGLAEATLERTRGQ